MKYQIAIYLISLITVTSSSGLALDFNSLISEGITAEKSLRDTLKGERQSDLGGHEKKVVRVTDEIKEVEVTSGEIFASKEVVEPIQKSDASEMIDEEILGLSDF